MIFKENNLKTSNGVNTKTSTILIAGAVFTAGFIMGFGGYVFAGENYNSSKSNTSTGIINRDVGNLLIDYGYGGEVVNQVTEALARGVTTDELRAILGGTSARSPAVVEEVLQKLEVELKRLGMGISKDGTQGVSTPDAGGAVPSASEGNIKDILPSDILPIKEISTPGAGDIPQPATVNQELHRPPTSTTGQPTPVGEQRFKSVDGLDSETRSGMFIKLGDLPGKRAAFGDSARKSIQDLKAAESEEESKKIRQELETNRRALLPAVQRVREGLSAHAQELRDNFRENVKTTIGHVDHGKTARIAVAHGKGLRMINRYRSAIARFDHILGRLESRIEKIRIETEAQARELNITVVIEINGKELAILLIDIEEAKNMQALNEAKLVQLEAKYESLLTGENPQRVAEEAREIAKELKSEIEKLHGLLGDIRQATGIINTTKSNTF